MSSEINNLVKRAKNGSAEAFGELYEIYAKDMYRFAYYYLGSSAAAEDAVSECVLLAFQKIGSLKKNSSFKTWIFKILRNCCNNALREKMKNINNVDIFSVQNLAADEKDENEILSLRQALDKLSDEEREIVILYYCAGYSSKEIGEIMGLKDSTVRSKIMRSGEKLRTYLQI